MYLAFGFNYTSLRLHTIFADTGRDLLNKVRSAGEFEVRLLGQHKAAADLSPTLIEKLKSAHNRH